MTESQDTIIAMNKIDKSFPGVQALYHVDFTLARGEIHALVGENGAGKSTLIKVLTGVVHPDSGTIELEGKAVDIRSPQQAYDMGISTVYQEINLCSNLTVAENILIGNQPRKPWGVDWKELNAQAREALARLGVDVDVTKTLGSYSVAVQQMAAIARALQVETARVLILDEPTSSLDANETKQLFEVMNRLRSQGVSIIFITHFLDQIYEVSDRITILRNGRLVGMFETEELPRFELVKKMIGRTLSEFENMSESKQGSGKKEDREVILKAEDLGRFGAIKPFDLDIHAGEVVGLAGLLGSGRTEIAHLLFGIDQPDSGTLWMGDKDISEFTPLDSIRNGITLCPEDRKAHGLVDDLTIRENIILAMQSSRGWARNISLTEQYEIADRFINLLNISPPNPDQKVKTLSGGNQQKVILARWLAINPQVLILDEPTRGIDVGTKAEIQQLVLQLAEEGKSCVFISSELEEVLRTSHRIIVLRDHVKVSELTENVSEHQIMQSIAGSEK